IGDWQGVPAIGSDAQGDSAPNTDIVTAFAAQEGGSLFFRIDIANVENQAPVVNDATFTLAENSANGTNVGSPITFTDPDTGQTHTFTITAGNTGGAFAIDTSTGQITVANSAALDFETTPSFSPTVQVTDDGAPPQSGTATVTINLTNVNEAPVVNPVTFSLAENSVNGTAVGTATFTDFETGQTHTFAITAGNTGGAFAINTTSGQITVANSTALDFEITPSFGLTVQVTDSGSPAESGTATITVNLTDVNEPPVANPQSVTITEDTPVTITLTGSDPENQTLSFIPTSPSQGVLSGTAPNLTYTPNANFSGPDSFTFTVSDGTNTSAPATITITITAVDDPPVAVNDAATVNEDSGATAINVLANDTDVDGGPISIVSVTQPGNGTVGITGGGTGLTYQPNPNYCNSLPGGNPNDTFTYTLTPGGSTTTVSVTVTCFNDAPVAQPKTASAQANMKIEGLSGLLVGVTDADANVDGCAPTFTVASLTSGTGGTVSNLDPAAGTFDFEPDPGFTGTATASYTVQDNGCPLPAATSASATIGITVNGPVIWFVTPAAGTSGTGTLADPFTNLASANTAKGSNTNHRIFVYTGMTTAGTGVSLTGDTTQAGAQWLIGQGASGVSFDTLMGIAPPAGTTPRPGINGARPTIQGTLTLNGNNVKAQGFNLTIGTATGMNDAAGAISGVSVSEVSVASTTGTAVNLSSLSGTVSLTSVSASGGTNGIV
ncbi:MAG: Ig-like domain-containing protein, partial [Accumulibacter sp.]|uniref:Ig-like domain-containing protein n=1 Tax=Accumulibacter sp. TaxID=2053492 RepID=UPI003314D33E